jgi:hypothetical protein
VVRECPQIVGGVPGEVVAEAIVAGSGSAGFPAKVVIAHGLARQVDGLLPPPGLIRRVGERGQILAEVLRHKDHHA